MWYLILKLHHPRLTSPPSEQGFSMIEVLVSIMVTAAFLMGTLQAMFINAIFQVRAEREAQATFWIQEDIEKVKAVAELDPFSGSDPTNTLSDTKATICGYRYFYRLVSSTGGTTVVQRGYGGQLRDYLYTNFSSGGTTDKNVQIAAEKNLVNKRYRLVRIVEGVNRTTGDYTEANKTPHVLRITYKVGEPDNSTSDRLKADNGKGFSETLAQVYTEVIPGGTFKCGS